MSNELQFIIFVEVQWDVARLVMALRERLSGTFRVRYRSFDWSHNWVQVWENLDHDAHRVDDPQIGYIHYRYRIEVSPNSKDVDVHHQVTCARKLLEIIESLGAKAVVGADFEDLL